MPSARSTRFKVLDIDASMSRQPVSYSTRTGATFATPETTPLALYTRLFGAGFQDPNSDNWKPDPSIMLRQSVLSAVTDQRQALMAGAGKADQIKLDQYFTSVREMENQLAIQLQKPEKCEACVVPTAPKEMPRSASVDVVRANTKAMARLLAMGLACNQTRVFNFVHTAGTSETYIAGQSKIYHQITHDEPTDAKLGYQPETSKLAGLVMQALRRLPDRNGRDQGGRRHGAGQQPDHGVQRHGLRQDPLDRKHPDVPGWRGGRQAQSGSAHRHEGRVSHARFADGAAARRRAGRRVRLRLDEDRAPDYRSHRVKRRLP